MALSEPSSTQSVQAGHVVTKGLEAGDVCVRRDAIFVSRFGEGNVSRQWVSPGFDT
jgi:hypothetical protein